MDSLRRTAILRAVDASEPPTVDTSKPRLAWLPWVLLGAILAGLGLVVFKAYRSIERSSAEKAMLGNLRQLSAALDQVTIEEGYRIFFRYDELVGRGRYLSAQHSVAGESYADLFPTRAGFILTVTAPNGFRCTYDPVSGVATPPPDGIVKTTLEDGRRFETTWAGGVPHGPFRAYYADGKLWGEATYDRGRVVGPAWLHTRDGRKFDELKDGPAAVAAIVASLKSDTADVRTRGLQKLEAKDYAGAEADLTAALAIDSTDTSLRRARAIARVQLGNIDGAISDSAASEGHTDEHLDRFEMSRWLADLVLRRARQRKVDGHPEADADLRAYASTAIWMAERALGSGPLRSELSRAERALMESDRHYPWAETSEMLGYIHVQSRRWDRAESAFTDALTHAQAGRMRTPGNAGILPAHYLYRRGHVRRWKGDLAGAEQDFRAARPGLGFAAAIQQADAACWLFLVQAEQGKATEARAELAALDRSEWHPTRQALADHLLGRAPESVVDIGGPDTKAQVIIGLLRRHAGDAPSAKTWLERAARSENYDNFEQMAASLALR